MTAQIFNLGSNVLPRFRRLINLAWDYVWLHICVTHVRWFIKYRNVRFLGDLLRRMTMLSGSSDTNANLCLFLRLLYTYCPPSMAFDRRERVFAHMFLEKQYVIATWIIRKVGLRILPPLLRPLYLSYYCRATKASEFVNRCLDNGTEQLIILGAGFDSTAYRLRDKRIIRDAGGTSKFMEVYEVDRPSVQQRKLGLMKAHLSEAEMLYYTEGVRFVECEFGVDSICRSLLRAGFTPSRSAAVLWEGVTYYLDAKALDQSLSELQDLFSIKTRHLTAKNSPATYSNGERMVDSDLDSPSGNTRASEIDDIVEVSRPVIFMDYMSTADTLNDERGDHLWLWDLARDQAAALGTSFMSGFSDVEAELLCYGLRLVHHLDSDAILHSFDKDTTGYHEVFREENATLGHNQPKLALVECEFIAT